MKLTLTKSEAQHLLKLLIDNEREGDYYGNLYHYLKRHYKLREAIEDLLEKEKINKLK